MKPFETARTRQFRKTELDPSDEQTIGHVEEFGCSIVKVAKTACAHGWAYTIGVFDTAGAPELVAVGLPEKTAHRALNHAADLLRAGVDLTKARHADIIGNVDCEFRPVDRKWVARIMNWSVWYYGNADFPALQLIYPDLENRFPNEDGLDERFRRPRLQPDAPMEREELDFWDSIDSDSAWPNWKFADSPHTGVFLSKPIGDGTEPVTYVSHDAEDGAWQLLGDSMSDGGDPILSCLHHPVDRDPSIAELADLPLGWYAERDSVGAPWIRHQLIPEDSDS